ncbi:mCG117698, isoform CRA_b [Mus musculus]|nr:mCG117698, isoform CRA_b [Mus musculus]
MCLSEVKWSSTLGKTWRNEENKWLKQNALQWRDKKRLFLLCEAVHSVLLKDHVSMLSGLPRRHCSEFRLYPAESAELSC